MFAGRTFAGPRTAAVMTATNGGLNGLEFLFSEDAQQLSAWACVRTRSDPERRESPLCMGHSQPSAQHAIRASGLGIHPAQIASFPAIKANVSARAATRWTSLTTLGCAPREALSNSWFKPPLDLQIWLEDREARPRESSCRVPAVSGWTAARQ